MPKEHEGEGKEQGEEEVRERAKKGITKENRGAAGKNGNRAKGGQEEQKAAEYLEQKGFRILKRNFYSRYGEIDIIAKDGDYLVFAEVRYRRDGRGGHPLETVDIRKQKRICQTADWFCRRYGWGTETPCRFDVVGITEKEMIHIENAFSYIT